MSKTEGVCEMCGHFVSMRQKSHIVAESDKSETNILKLCPTCHLIFDMQLKNKLYNALSKANVKNLPKSWKLTLHEQAWKTIREKKAKKK